MSAASNSHAGLKNLNIRTAQNADVAALAALINNAFRVEQPFIEGDRTDPDGVRNYGRER